MLFTFLRRFSTFRPGNLTSEKMVRVLNVAEKNDAAKSLANIMSNGRCSKREGFSKFNKIYEFDYNFMQQQAKMSMTSVSGHLLALEFTGLFKKWNSCNPVELFTVPVERYCPDNFKDIKRTLEREIKGCQYLVIWTDGDREGENIGFEIIEVCQAVKPNIKVLRAKFSEITPQAITRAMNNLAPPDHRINDAVNVRIELDLRIGAAFTRFQTLRLKRIFPENLSEQLISYGSCQFPTLGFVVERYKQVQEFIPEPFWKIKVTHISDEVKADFSWKRNRTFDHQVCQVLFEQCIESPVASVTDVKSKSKSKWRPQPLDTVELEKLASRKLRINAKETMKIAEKLYTQGFISYPRTETNMFPKELDLTSLVQAQTNDPAWGDFAAGVLECGPNPRNGSKTDNAHPPIHPLKYTDNLQGNEQKIYEFIVRHFLACVSQDAQGHETIVEIDIAQERFTAQGLMILARNYLDVYPYEKWNAKEIPIYCQGDQFEPNSIEIVAGETTAPPLLTEADLIALMEKHGIGTDATHADHIETVKNRMYVGLQPDGKFVPGQLGMGLCEGYDSMGYEMSKPNLRAELEADLKLICDGHKDANVALQVHIQAYKEVFIEACRQAQKLDEALAVYLGEARSNDAGDEMQVVAPSIVMPCPKCGKPMVLRTKKDGKGYYIGCSNYPDCKSSFWLPESVLQVSCTEEICANCSSHAVKKLNFKFKPNSVPPSISSNYIGCIGGCNEMLNEALGIRPFRPFNPSTTPSGQNRSPAVNSNSRSNSRGGGNSVNSRGGGNSLSSRGGGNSLIGRGGGNSENGRGGGNSLNSRGGNTGGNKRSIHTASPYGTTQPVVNTNRANNNNNSFSSPNYPSLNMNRNGWNVQQNASTNNNRSTNFPPNRPSVSGSRGDDRDKTIVCGCGNDAILLTVRKEGPNTGRQFYKCRSQDDNNCNFFLWLDDDTANNSNNSSSDSPWRTTNSSVRPQQQSSNHANHSSNGFSNEDVMCRCGQSAKMLTVQKEGPNTGRQFYGCNKPREQSCGFFQWADEAPREDNTSRQPRTPLNSNRKGPNPFLPQQDGKTNSSKKKKLSSDGNGPKTRKPPCCGYCGQPGHKKPSCPERGQF